jgi:hypothetical protein
MVRWTLAAVTAITLASCRGDRASTATVVAASGSEPAPRLQLAAVDPTWDQIRTAAHAVLVAHCGECHEGHRSTAKPAALAIFDLDRADWPSRFDEGRFEAGLRRFGGATAKERDAFVAFRDAALARP